MTVRSIRRLLVATALVAFASSATAADLIVSAAASLTNAFNEIGRSFEAQNPGVKVQFNYASSGALLQQIAKGAPVDVFASADEQTMDDAQKQDLVDVATRADFVRNSLVVVVPTDSKRVPTSLADLGRNDVKTVAIGQPASVPVGRYTKSVLEEASLWSTIETKMIGAQSVRQVLDYVARGEVDAGFVYATDAAIMTDRVRVAFSVPTPKPILYPVAVLKNAGDKEAAQRFVRFVNQPESQAILARYGFAKP